MERHEQDALDTVLFNVQSGATEQSSRLLHDGGFVNAFRIGNEIHWTLIQGKRFLKGIRQADGTDVIQPALKAVTPRTWGVPTVAQLRRIVD
jgi:hypothetical protein